MSIVVTILLFGFLMILVGDLSLITETAYSANWAPEPNNVPYMGDPTQVVMPRHVKPVKPAVSVKPIRRGIFAAPSALPLVEEVAVPVKGITLRNRLFSKPQAVYFV